MTTLTTYDIEFFEITTELKNKVVNKTKILKTLLKLNNPTYYSKYIFKNPIEKHGYSSKIVKNPILLAIQNMLISIKSNKPDDIIIKELQTEVAWAYNNYTV
jgi:hypothetical protein